jgi:hypothetical protein
MRPDDNLQRRLIEEIEASRVEAPPPARRLSAMDWDEFVAGHRAGLIEWNTARLSPGRGGQVIGATSAARSTWPWAASRSNL